MSDSEEQLMWEWVDAAGGGHREGSEPTASVVRV